MEYLNSVGTGAVDTMRGVAGFETGRWEAYTVEFAAPTLGLVFNDDGCVSSLQPGGEAERRGVRLNDSVTHINGAPVGDRSQSALHLAVASQPSRPLAVAFERRAARDYDAQLGSVNFRLDEESAKAESILTIMLDSPIAGPHPHVIKHCAGLAFLRVTRVAFQAGVSWGTGCVVARLPGGGWSPPSAIGTAGASFGWQIGAEVADFVVVLHGARAVATFAGGGAVRLGTSIGVALGPLGGGNELNLDMGADVAGTFTYAVSKGLFAGVSLDGSEINERNAVNERHYARRGVRAADILSGAVPPTPACAGLHGLLRRLDASVPPYHFGHHHYYRPPPRVYVQEPAAYAQPPPPVYAPPPPPAPQPMSEEQQVAEAMRRSMQDQ